MASTAPKRRLPRPERRLVIEDAASVLFARHGYADTRLEEIAAAAGVSKQLLYRHFASKKELHLALLVRHRDELLGGLAAGMAEPGPLERRIPQALDRWFGYVEEHPYAAAMLFRDTTGDPEVQAVYRELQASARAANVALLRESPVLAIPEERIEPVAELIRAGVVGLALWWAEHPEVPRATVVGVAVDVVGGGLGLQAGD